MNIVLVRKFVWALFFLAGLVGAYYPVYATLPEAKSLFGFDPAGDTLLVASRVFNDGTVSQKDISVSPEPVTKNGEYALLVGKETFLLYNPSKRKLDDLEKQFERTKAEKEKAFREEIVREEGALKRAIRATERRFELLKAQKGVSDAQVLERTYKEKLDLLGKDYAERLDGAKKKYEEWVQKTTKEHRKAIGPLKRRDENYRNLVVAAQGRNYDLLKKGGLLKYDGVCTVSGNSKKTVLIGCHGFRAHKTDFGMQSAGDVDILRFNFIDGGLPFDFTGLRRLTGINLGQQADALVVLYYLAACYEAGYEAAAFFALCRGASAVVGALEMLENYALYKDYWQKLGYVSRDGRFDTKAIFSMQRMVQKGLIILARPLMNPNVIIKLRIKDKVPLGLQKIPGIVGAVKKGIACATSVRLSQEEPVDRLEKMVLAYAERGAAFPYRVCIFLGRPDPIVYNVSDGRIIALAQLTKQQIQVFSFTPALLNENFFGGRREVQFIAEKIHGLFPDAGIMGGQFVKDAAWFRENPGKALPKDKIPALLSVGRAVDQNIFEHSKNCISGGCFSKSEKDMLDARIKNLAERLKKALEPGVLSKIRLSANSRRLFTDGLTKPGQFFDKAIAAVARLKLAANEPLDKTKKINKLNGMLTELAHDRLWLQDLLAKASRTSMADSSDTAQLKAALAKACDDINGLFMRIIADGEKYILSLKKEGVN